MRNIALQLMYVGSNYHGWQIQKNAVTVEETLEHALGKIVGHPVKCTGAGRTDAGVHALTYVANFHTSSSIPCDRLPLAVNTRLPDDIAVTRAVEVSEGFNAISSCVRRIGVGSTCLGFLILGLRSLRSLPSQTSTPRCVTAVTASSLPLSRPAVDLTTQPR